MSDYNFSFRKPKILTTSVASTPPETPETPSEPSNHPHFGRRIKAQRVPQPRPAAIITQPRPFGKIKDPIHASDIRKRIIKINDEGGANRAPVSGRKKQVSIPSERIETGSESPSKTQTVAKGDERLKNPAVIRLVSTVAPKPFTGRSTTVKAKQPSTKTKKRTVVRRLPIRPPKKSTTSSIPTTTTTVSTTQISDSTTKSTPEQVKGRMRLADSLLARVQGKFIRARSTTPPPGQPIQSAVKNDILLIRRNRNRLRNANRNSTTEAPTKTTEVQNPPVTPRSFKRKVPSPETKSKDRTGGVRRKVLPKSRRTTAKPVVSSTEVHTVSTSTTPKTTTTATTPFSTTTTTTVTTTTTTATTTKSTTTTTATTRRTTTTTAVPSSSIPTRARKPLRASTTRFSKTANVTRIPTRNLNVKLPQRVSDTSSDESNPGGLRKDLLAAIRRKISKGRSAAPITTTTTSKPKFGSNFRGFNARKKPASLPSDVSPASNAVVSTERAVYQRIPVPPPKAQSPVRGSPTPKVNFFLRVPNGKPGNPVKIKNISHIQGKLKRLNAAISEGIAQQRREQEQQREEMKKLMEEKQSKLSRPTPKVTTTRLPVVTTASSKVIKSNVVLSVAKNVFKSRTTTTETPETTERYIQATSTRNGYDTTSRTNYLDVLRQRTKAAAETTTSTTTSTTVKSTSSTTTTTSTSTSTSTTTTTATTRRPTTRRAPTTTRRPRPPTTTTPQRTERVIEIEPRPAEHPTSHFRPHGGNVTNGDSIVTLVRPNYGDYQNGDSHGQNGANLTEGDMPEGVIHDISGTTVYVVAVICVIPAAGLVAWIARYALRKRVTITITKYQLLLVILFTIWIVFDLFKFQDLSIVDSGSETGLNCPISAQEDDIPPMNPSLGVTTSALASSGMPTVRTMGQGGAHEIDVESISETYSKVQTIKFEAFKINTINSYVLQVNVAELSELLVESPWQFNRSHLRLQTVLGEGNFGKVWKAEADSICGYEGTILVAVKTAKEGAPQKEVGDLLQEMRIMQDIGPHPNVVAMLGVCVETGL